MLGRVTPAQAATSAEAQMLRVRVGSLEAEIALLRQDVKGCERVFDALSVPCRALNGDLLRSTGRASLLLQRYRQLHTLAVGLNRVIDTVAGLNIEADLLLADLAPEEP